MPVKRFIPIALGITLPVLAVQPIIGLPPNRWPARYPSVLWWVLVLVAGAVGLIGVVVRALLDSKRQEAARLRETSS